ncbi:MAG: thioredoxin domain-containing protein [Deltaproteobacteria bacterium]|nr:thioredoxin domain-containing protein [Deltaproteobacteria bacterium]
MPNRLIHETSPYLLQHAHNPVDWYPWGDEAFARAKREQRPILLSIGYSTCHWCHVMEHESFEDPEIAEVMNRLYVSVKVDREERPDVDAIYMSAVQLLSGQGGWPMTVWLTPDREPFYAATYIPPRDGARGVRVGFKTMLEQLRTLFDTTPERVQAAAADLVRAVRESLASERGGDPVDAGVITRALEECRRRFDPEAGGVRGAPKFPSSMPVRLLMRLHERTGDLDAAKMVRLTLDGMANGGIYDHLAGGFHRYSTDAEWLVPHFEKMLYDNALLASAYAEAFSLFGRAEDAAVCREIIDYVLRDMTAANGAFYSATDADSLTPDGHKDEGYFFTWTQQEVKAELGAEAEAFCRAYGVSAEGNFEGRNVLSLQDASARAQLTGARKKLLAARNERPQPMRDEKHITAWNGLMVSALAVSGFALNEPRHVDAAVRAAQVLWSERFSERGFSRVGKAPGFLDDQANMLAACVDLYLATSDPTWIVRARKIAEVLEGRFLDREGGGFFNVPEGGETLIAREKPSYDGAEPSGSSTAAIGLLRLARVTGDERLRSLGERTVRAFSRLLAGAPQAMGEMLIAVDLMERPVREVVIVGDAAARAPFVDVLRRGLRPGLVWAAGDERAIAELGAVVPFASNRQAIDGRATVYVCENMACRLPVHTVEDFVAALDQLTPPATPR